MVGVLQGSTSAAWCFTVPMCLTTPLWKHSHHAMFFWLIHDSNEMLRECWEACPQHAGKDAAHIRHLHKTQPIVISHSLSGSVHSWPGLVVALPAATHLTFNNA